MFTYLNKRRKKGQSTLEYAVLIIIIIGALLSIQVYIKRGIQGRMKGAADDIGDQFSPGNTNVISTMTTLSKTKDTFKKGISTSKLTANEVTETITNTVLLNQDREFWGK